MTCTKSQDTQLKQTKSISFLHTENEYVDTKIKYWMTKHSKLSVLSKMIYIEA